MFTIAGMVLVVACCLVYNAYSTHLSDDALTGMQYVQIGESWRVSHSPFFYGVAGCFKKNGRQWNGIVNYSEYDPATVNQFIGSTNLPMRESARSVPDSVMQKVFQTLHGIPLRLRPISLAGTLSADTPSVLLAFQKPTLTLAFSSPRTFLNAGPWNVDRGKMAFVTKSTAPNEALALLRPYLHEDEIKNLSETTTPLITQKRGYKVLSLGVADESH